MRALAVVACLVAALTPQRMLVLGRGSAAASGGLTLLHQANFVDTGAFKVPTICGEDMQFGGGALGFNPAGNGGAGSLYMSTYPLNVVEVSIPTPVNSATLASLNTATCLQSAAEPTEGLKHAGDVGIGSSAYASPTAYAIIGSTLFINSAVFYDANAGQGLSLLKRPLNLSTSGQVHGPYGLSSTKTGYIPGMSALSLAAISSDWSSVMGGDLFAGKCCSNVITSESYGPAAIVLNSSTLADVNGVVLTTVSVASADNSFNDSSNSLPVFTVGTTVRVFDQDSASNAFIADNGTFTVVSSTVSKLVVSGATLTTRSAGDHFAFGRVYAAANAPLFYTASTTPAGACGVVGDDVANGVAQACNSVDGPGGTRNAVYKYWSWASLDGGLAQVQGTRTLIATSVVGGSSGTYGGYGYGCGCGTAPSGGNDGSGDPDCGGVDVGGSTPGDHCAGEGYYYDPEHSTDKGNHGYPYFYLFALYDMNDLAAVVAGSKTPGELRPYEWFAWTFPIMPNSVAGEQTRFSQPAVDQTNGYIYIAQWHGPNNAYPLTHRIQVIR